MIRRELEGKLRYIAGKMPVITITGPRQSGKTTLARSAFGDYQYVSFENADTRQYAETDPRGFLNEYGQRLVIDEAQYVPHIFSYIQGYVDEAHKAGMYVLTGSQNFLLLEKITQSLAGRVAIFHLMPFSINELRDTGFGSNAAEEYIVKGFYPRLYDHNLSPEEWLPDYIQSYVERDVRQIVNIGDLGAFRDFLGLCAGRTGQMINLSSMGNEIGVSYQTVKRWLSILETSFIVFLLPPFFRNFNKRIVKSPRLYFNDTGLVCSLLGIRNTGQLNTHYHKGALFENLVISDIRKNMFNAGRRPLLYYWRDSTGNEVDLIFEAGDSITALEIKAGKTINTSFFKGLDYFSELTGNEKIKRFLVYGGSEHQERSNAMVLGWQHTDRIEID